MTTGFRGVVLRTVTAGALALGLIGTGGPAVADDDDDPIDVRVLRKIMKGVGLKRPGEESEIEYRERSPLVVPPTRDLPAPEAAAVTERNPAWPTDPDVRKRREAAKPSARRSVDWEAEARALPRDQLDRKNTDPDAPKPSTAPQKSAEESARQSSPKELGYFGGIFSWKNVVGGPKEEYGSFEKEPPRVTLTEPPPGYRTPSPAQPYGFTKSKDMYKQAAPDPAVGHVGSSR